MQEDPNEPEDAFVEWDNWDKSSAPRPPTSQEAKQSQPLYSPSYSKQPPTVEPEPEPEPDYFSDLGLAPTIQKSKKVSCCIIVYMEFQGHVLSLSCNQLAQVVSNIFLVGVTL